MANRYQTAGKPMSVRIRAGSALETLLATAGSLTELVHELADQELERREAAGVSLYEAYEASVRIASPPPPPPPPPRRSTKVFTIRMDDGSQRVVGEEELLRIAAEQFPAGLVPIIDEGDVFEDDEEAGSIDQGVSIEKFDYESLL